MHATKPAIPETLETRSRTNSRKLRKTFLSLILFLFQLFVFKMLSEDSDDESIHQITINEHFAKAYEYRKEREELAKCQYFTSSLYV